MATEPDRKRDSDAGIPWQQRVMDNLWILLVLGTLIPGLLYLAWGLWELADLPTWGGR